MRRLLPLALLLLPCAARAEEEARSSEAIVTDDEAWAEPGFRMALTFGGGSALDLGDAPGDGLFVFGIEPGARVTESLSLLASIRYAPFLFDLTGLTWSTTVDALYHPYGGSYVGLGAGYVGLTSSDPYGGAKTCIGEGVQGSARAGWRWETGPIFASGPDLRADLFWTRCAVSFGDEPYGGRAQPALTFSWAFAWR